MPTDEQRMRERFEADCLHISEEQLARTKAGDYATEWVHGTWIGYAIAYKARDAEVQALRELLYEIKFKAGMSHINQTMEQQQRLLYDISDAVRAALAGGETGEAE